MSRCGPGQVMSWMGLLLAASVTAAAEPTLSPGFSLERLDLNPGAAGSLVVGTGELLPQGELRVSTVGHYQHNSLVLTQGGEVHPIIGHRLTTHLSAAYALTNWLELSAQLPLVALQRGDDLSARGLAPPTRYGVSTPLFGVRWGLLSQRNGHGADLALGLGLGLPVGTASGLPQDAGAQVTPQLMVGRRLGWFRLALETQALMRKHVVPAASQSVIEQPELGSELRFGAVAATVGRRLRWEVNLVGQVPLVNQPKSVELLLGTRYLLNPSVELFAVAGMGVGAAPGTPLFRAMVGSAFGGVTPPRLPGESSVNCSTDLKHSAEECPDLDEDQDGVLNGLDRCPYETGTPVRNGCPFRDQDGDGIEDALDACPTEFGDAAWKGCPAPDDDKDGVLNDQDSCPTVPGPAESRGCPKKDADGDGVEDDVDLCPTQAGKPELQGCPESDRDGDGVANRFDSCPDVHGTEENHGCPDHEMPLVSISRARFELMGRVFFVPSQPSLESRSNALLDWVAKAILEHPEFPVISVGAHTDNRGFADANLQLSRARALSVRQYLIQRGVAPERLEARGYGDTRPVDNNGTSIGRENNRRVEFLIIWPD
jgi:OmpA-OmpF porin, OOP family